jgi:hypothetical protein
MNKLLAGPRKDNTIPVGNTRFFQEKEKNDVFCFNNGSSNTCKYSLQNDYTQQTKSLLRLKNWVTECFLNFSWYLIYISRDIYRGRNWHLL